MLGEVEPGARLRSAMTRFVDDEVQHGAVPRVAARVGVDDASARRRLRLPDEHAGVHVGMRFRFRYEFDFANSGPNSGLKELGPVRERGDRVGHDSYQSTFHVILHCDAA